MLFIRIITGNQISNNVSFNKEIIYERYQKISLGNECAEVISTNLEEVKIGLFQKGFPFSIFKALQQLAKNKT